MCDVWKTANRTVTSEVWLCSFIHNRTGFLVAGIIEYVLNRKGFLVYIVIFNYLLKVLTCHHSECTIGSGRIWLVCLWGPPFTLWPPVWRLFDISSKNAWCKAPVFQKKKAGSSYCLFTRNWPKNWIRGDLLIIAPQLLHPGRNSYNKSFLKILQVRSHRWSMVMLMKITEYRVGNIISNNSHIFFRSENHGDILSPKKLAQSGTRVERKKGKAW